MFELCNFWFKSRLEYDFIPKNKLLFPEIICGEEGSEVELL